MNEALKPIFDWLSTNWGWVIAVFCIFFEITPIKINPITSICRFIGNRLTKDLKNDVEKAIALLSNGNELEQVTKIKFAARKYNIEEFRKMIQKMNKELSPYGFIALAETEYFFYGKKTAASRCKWEYRR